MPPNISRTRAEASFSPIAPSGRAPGTEGFAAAFGAEFIPIYRLDAQARARLPRQARPAILCQFARGQFAVRAQIAGGRPAISYRSAWPQANEPRGRAAISAAGLPGASGE